LLTHRDLAAGMTRVAQASVPELLWPSRERYRDLAPRLIRLASPREHAQTPGRSSITCNT